MTDNAAKATRGRHPSRSKTTPELTTLGTLLTAQEAAAATRRRGRRPLLIGFNDLEAWQKDNHFILTGYRPSTNSFMSCFQSLFYLSNESVNVHSHLLGTFLFSFIAVSVCLFEAARLSWADAVALACFFAGAVLCLGLSSGYHLFSNHSPDIARIGNQLDYVGIVLLIVGSFIPSVYFGFYCEPFLQRRYWTMICAIGIACTVVSIDSRFRTPRWRPFRACMFIAMGLSAVIPVFQAIVMYGFDHLRRKMGIFWLFLEGVLYITGATIYALRVPERLATGKFDIWGSSHQIFHILILFAAMSHLIGLLVSFNHAKSLHSCESSRHLRYQPGSGWKY